MLNTMRRPALAAAQPCPPVRTSVGTGLRTSLCTLMFAALGVCTPALADEDPIAPGQLDLQVTTELSQGRYGEPELTRTRQTSLSTRYRRGRWTLQVQVPWLNTSERGGSLSQAHSEAGMGDIWTSLSWEAIELDAEHTGIDLTLKHKSANGNEARGLGTGGTDVALQLEWTRLLGPMLAFGHLGYRRTGDVPGLAPYLDPWYTELGAQTTRGDWTTGFYYDARTPIGRRGALSELTGFAAWRLGAQRLQLYITQGYKTASPRWAAGLSMRSRF
jgi:hypothetical protein